VFSADAMLQSGERCGIAIRVLRESGGMLREQRVPDAHDVNRCNAEEAFASPAGGG